MAWIILTSYIAVALVAAVAVFVLSNRLDDERRPATHRVAWSLAAGVVWPVMLLGLAELSSVAAYAKVHEDEHEEGVAVLV